MYVYVKVKTNLSKGIEETNWRRVGRGKNVRGNMLKVHFTLV